MKARIARFIIEYNILEGLIRITYGIGIIAGFVLTTAVAAKFPHVFWSLFFGAAILFLAFLIGSAFRVGKRAKWSNHD